MGGENIGYIFFSRSFAEKGEKQQWLEKVESREVFYNMVEISAVSMFA